LTVVGANVEIAELRSVPSSVFLSPFGVRIGPEFAVASKSLRLALFAVFD